MNKNEYEIALAKIDELMDAETSEDIKELSDLAERVNAYELEHYWIPEPTPDELAEFRKDQER